MLLLVMLVHEELLVSAYARSAFELLVSMYFTLGGGKMAHPGIELELGLGLILHVICRPVRQTALLKAKPVILPRMEGVTSSTVDFSFNLR
ncbi:hypothetical protein TNIN_361691 [Trichonephila inaurata madagascariensis]|uniref:Secreted protein n=1 Tax=Trichonephila inaurata madagascariensis TaxID=2747483 RepID=A0A8X6ISI1_9ARAC|nr:hypothetical protein TNIN_360281 [Trichonephila inaurata madagascariensis]GFY57662.1 hypothetical protein TNIN_361691 [Trichonephila inaurata madagascariensis]